MAQFRIMAASVWRCRGVALAAAGWGSVVLIHLKLEGSPRALVRETTALTSSPPMLATCIS